MKILQALPQYQKVTYILWSRFFAILSQLFLSVFVFKDILNQEYACVISIIFVLFLLLMSIAVTLYRLRLSTPLKERELVVQLCIDLLLFTLWERLNFHGEISSVSFYLPGLIVAFTILCNKNLIFIVIYSVILFYVSSKFTFSSHLNTIHSAKSLEYYSPRVSFLMSTFIIIFFVKKMNDASIECSNNLIRSIEYQKQSDIIFSLALQASSSAHNISKPISTAVLALEEIKLFKPEERCGKYFDEYLSLALKKTKECTRELTKMSLSLGFSEFENEEVINLCTWLRNVFDSFEVKSNKKVTYLLPDVCIYIKNAGVLHTIIINLLENANSAISSDNGFIHCSCQVENGYAMIRITDNGCGIPSDLIDSLGKKPVKSTTSGHGIGLVLAFSNAVRIGAEIILCSDYAGTVATVRMRGL
ncbi:sensor histidine kinase [Yersinia pekkanenii]|uniref:histidine kinase n=1 Tax=Yersinia pekkanenii TaxID=1288385 RepID=A0A0T9PIJ8_9GAMM|nr:HAMP domain-containing sensor histidine kinase [Yersinia pekkanenii]CNH67055.1 C4-dicarboxylate transport sensor protein dctB [Yersinia pekkanenii]CRY67034.1 C4-dicarboxylate transport sensor protein dctB [Yersinia pekkanenii]